MLTIHNLEVRFDVEAGDEDTAFGRLFAEHINRWSQRHEAERSRLAELQDERALGDQDGEQAW
jgi:hypothetical protein